MAEIEYEFNLKVKESSAYEDEFNIRFTVSAFQSVQGMTEPVELARHIRDTYAALPWVYSTELTRTRQSLVVDIL